MSAPPIGMIMSTPSTSAMMVISQKSSALPEMTRPTMKNTSATPSAMLMTWRNGRMIGAPLIRADNFRNAITEPVKVKALLGVVAGRAEVNRFRGVERAGRDQHGGHTDEGVEGRDQFRHRGHRHAAR